MIALLALDLGVLHRKQREIGVSESLALSAGYIALSMGFGAWVWWYMGETAGMNYLTGFVIEKSLAMDNVFVIAMIFSYFAVHRLYQHRVLFWGIIGVILLRAIMIGFGAAIVEQFSWVLYVFAAFLIATGIKMWVMADTPYDVGNSAVLRWVRRRFRVTDRLHGQAFWVKETDPKTGRLAWFMTPLFLALIMIEFVDVVFAVDSVPAIFAITTDPFIVYTSNIFAILGLRALFRTGGDGRSLPLSEIRAGGPAGVHRLQDLRGGRLRAREDPAGRVARHYLRDPAGRRRLVAVEDARAQGQAVDGIGWRRTRTSKAKGDGNGEGGAWRTRQDSNL